jgi:hypothetical protein
MCLATDDARVHERSLKTRTQQHIARVVQAGILIIIIMCELVLIVRAIVTTTSVVCKVLIASSKYFVTFLLFAAACRCQARNAHQRMDFRRAFGRAVTVVVRID